MIIKNTRNVLPCFLASIPCITYLFYFLFNIKIFPLGLIASMDIPFGDSLALTFLKNCTHSLIELYQGAESCDPYLRPFNYPAGVYYISSLIPRPAFYHLGCFASLSIASITVAHNACSETRKVPSLQRVWLFIVLFLNYPLYLAIERGNYELFVYLLIVLASLPLPFTQPLARSVRINISFLLFFIGSILKVYPAIGFVSAAAGLNKPRYWIISSALLILLFLYLSPTIGYISQNTPRSQGGLGFGFLALYSDDLIGYSWILLALKACLLIASSFLVYTTLIRVAAGRLKAYLFSAFPQSTLHLLVVFVLIYLLSVSYDYRLILLLPAMPRLFRLAGAMSSHCQPSAGSVILRNIPLLASSTLFEGFLAGDAWPPSTMNNIAKLSRVTSDVVLQPLLVGCLISVIILSFRYSSSTQRS